MIGHKQTKRYSIQEKSKDLAIVILCTLLIVMFFMGYMGTSFNVKANESDLETKTLDRDPVILSERSLIKTKQPSEEGIKDDFGRSITVDSQGNIILVGDTMSADFQTWNAYDNVLDGPSDVIVTKFDPNGLLLWSSYLGGDDIEEGWDIA
ncbi:MAG: SBBP repeat-containing protein, partial [Candidatus Hodarchaeota archaeon]